MENKDKIAHLLLIRVASLGVGALFLGGLLTAPFQKLSPKDVLAVAGTLKLPTTQTITTINSTTVNVTSALNLPGGIWNSSGNVGIGTTTPNAKLSFGPNTGAAAVYLYDGGASSYGMGVQLHEFQSFIPTVANDATGHFSFNAGGGLQTSGTNELMRITNGGLVGIGTTAPARLVDIHQATDTASSGLGVSNAAVAQRINLWVDSGSVGRIDEGATGTGVISLNGVGTGFVGIGTTAPLEKLDIAGDVNMSGATSRTINFGTTGVAGPGAATVGEKIQLYGTAGTNGVADYALGVESSNMWFNTGGGFKWYKSGVAEMALDASGQLGIGTTAPATPLEVVGSVQVHDSSVAADNAYAGALRITRPVASGQYINLVRSGTSGFSIGTVYNTSTFGIGGIANPDSGFTAPTFVITTGGNVGIGITAPSYKLQVTGSFYASGSSKKFKENIKDIEVDSSKIYSLRPVSFDYKPQYKSYGKDLGGGRQIGLIAEEVYQTIPELAVKLNNQVSNVDYEKLSVLLLSETQKQKKEIDSLKSDLKDLKARLILIESKLK